MASALEQDLARALRAVLAGRPHGATIAQADLRDIVTALEFLLPKILRESHAEWEHESLDGILPAITQKVRDDEVELFGECILISDQTTVPFQLCVQLSPCATAGSSGSACSCRLIGLPSLALPGKRAVAHGAASTVLKLASREAKSPLRSSGRSLPGRSIRAGRSGCRWPPCCGCGLRLAARIRAGRGRGTRPSPSATRAERWPPA